VKNHVSRSGFTLTHNVHVALPYEWNQGLILSFRVLLLDHIFLNCTTESYFHRCWLTHGEIFIGLSIFNIINEQIEQRFHILLSVHIGRFCVFFRNQEWSAYKKTGLVRPACRLSVFERKRNWMPATKWTSILLTRLNLLILKTDQYDFKLTDVTQVAVLLTQPFCRMEVSVTYVECVAGCI